MKLFKQSKKQPIKFRNFKFIGVAKNYANICYYYKELPRDNFELMTLNIEVTKRKPEVGAGTNVKVIDPFMATYLYAIKNDLKINDRKEFVSGVICTTFSDFEEKTQKDMIKKFNSVVPKEIKEFESYKKAKKEGFNILYCSNDENKDRSFGVVNLVMVKDEKIVSKDERIDINSAYTYFKPLKFMVSPMYLAGKTKEKYIEIDLQDVIVDHDLLI